MSTEEAWLSAEADLKRVIAERNALRAELAEAQAKIAAVLTALNKSLTTMQGWAEERGETYVGDGVLRGEEIRATLGDEP